MALTTPVHDFAGEARQYGCMSLTLDQRLSRPRPAQSRTLPLRLLGAVGAGLLLTLWLASLFETPSPASLPPPDSEPLWQAQGEGAYRLSGDFGQARSLTRLRRDGARQDIMVLGDGLAARHHARLVVHQAGTQDQPPGSFYLDVARMAALAGVAVTRSQLPQAVPTRFGQLEIAELTLTQGATERACAGLRLLVSAPDLRLTGFACLGEGLRDPQTFACFIDRLEFDGASAEPALTAFFTKAQTARPACVVSQTQVRNVERPSRIIPASR